MTTYIYDSAYIPEMDRTVIFKYTLIDDNLVSEEISGWYAGEPEETLNEEYKESGVIAQFG